MADGIQIPNTGDPFLDLLGVQQQVTGDQLIPEGSGVLGAGAFSTAPQLTAC